MPRVLTSQIPTRLKSKAVLAHIKNGGSLSLVAKTYELINLNTMTGINKSFPV